MQIRNEDDTASDLSDYGAVMQIRSTPNPGGVVYARYSDVLSGDGSGLNMNPLVNSVLQPKSSGSINLHISYASSSNFAFSNAYYLIGLTTGSITMPLLEGRIRRI